MSARRKDRQVLVIGLGRFGRAVAETLTGLRHEVMAVDSDPEIVQRYSELFAHVVEADATEERALEQLGAPDFKRAVVGIGTDIEASILTTSALVDLGVDEIWAKAVTASHGKILDRVGAHHVVYPERESGERIGHRVTGRMLDYIELDENFALVEAVAPGNLVGRSLGESEVRRRFGITVVCIKTSGEPFTYATRDSIVKEGDILVVAGEHRHVEDFAAGD